MAYAITPKDLKDDDSTSLDAGVIIGMTFF